MSSISSKAHKNIWTVELSTMLSWLLMILLMTPSVKSWNQRNSFRYVLVGIGNQNTKQLGRSKLGGILLNGLLSQISVSCLPTYFMRKRGKFVLFTGYYFPRSSSNCMHYIEFGERSISRKNTILLPPLFLLLPLVVVVVVAWPFINFVSVQLSMITGKASIIILVVSTAYLVETLSSIHQQRNQSQQHSNVVYILRMIIGKMFLAWRERVKP